jgi:metal-responsive CopG/Arc/MetJ family transcriptional regulator
MGERGGRSLRGIEETGYTKYNITLPPSIIERLDKYMKEEDRNRSWTIQKALDEYLKKKGY